MNMITNLHLLSDQDKIEDTVEAEVFKKSYIPRVLDEVLNFEQDLSKVGPGNNLENLWF